jgi:hypothetical protein
MRACFAQRWFGALALICVCLAPRAARAGTPDLLVQIAPRPEDSDLILLAYQHGGDGFFYSRDRGETYSVLCSATISELGEDGQYIFANSLEDSVVTADDHVLVGGTRGLWVDDGQLCNWQRAPELKNEWVTSLAHDPRDLDVVYGALATSMSEDNGLFRRNADGSIERVGERSSIKIHALEIAERPDGSLRFYQAAIVGSVTVLDEDAQVTLPDGGSIPRMYEKQIYALRYSDDEGESWTEHEVETEVGTSVTIEAIHPTDHERVVLRLQRASMADTVIIAEQGGAMQRPWFEVADLSGVAFEPSGALWIAGQGMGDGVMRAERLGDEPSMVRDQPAYCVAFHGGELELCDRMDYGIADKTTARLPDPRLFDTADRVHSCEGMDVVEHCRSLFCTGRCAGNHWPESPMCADSYDSAAPFGCSSDVTPRDAGAVDAGSRDAGSRDAGERDAGGTRDAGVSEKSSGCSCGVLAARGEGGALGGLGLLSVLALLARRARRLTAS